MVQDEARVQLTSKIPKQLHRDLKLHCVTSDVSLMDFVTESIVEKLGRGAKAPRAVRSRK